MKLLPIFFLMLPIFATADECYTFATVKSSKSNKSVMLDVVRIKSAYEFQGNALRLPDSENDLAIKNAISFANKNIGRIDGIEKGDVFDSARLGYGNFCYKEDNWEESRQLVLENKSLPAVIFHGSWEPMLGGPNEPIPAPRSALPQKEKALPVLTKVAPTDLTPEQKRLRDEKDRAEGKQRSDERRAKAKEEAAKMRAADKAQQEAARLRCPPGGNACSR